MKYYHFFIVLFLLSGLFLPVQSQNSTLKILEPTVGETIDISNKAKKRVEELRELYYVADSILKSPTSETFDDPFDRLTPEQREVYIIEEMIYEADSWDVDPWGCSWYCGGGPDSIYTSSTLTSSSKYDYSAHNLHDFSLNTAWIEGANGDGIGEGITYRFAAGSPPVTTIILYNGYMKSEKTWKENSRVKQLKLYINDEPYGLLNLKDVIAPQFFDIDEQQGKGTPLYLKFEIVDVYKGSKYEDTAISEINFDGTGVHCFAAGTQIASPTGDISIENLKEGDIVFSYDAIANVIEPTTVISIAKRHHHNLYELDFEGNKITTTNDHPFFFNGEYFSVMENNKYGVSTSEFAIGQAITIRKKGKIDSARLTDMKKLSNCEDTYTITKLEKNTLFFANGFCVSVE